MSPRSIRLGRLNDGAAVLDSHDQFQVASILGSIVPGSAAIVNGAGVARARLTDTPDAADAIAKLRAGHLRSISVGYIVHAWRGLEDDPQGVPQYLAVDWEPVEVSLVSVPADPGAHVRSGSEDMTILSARNRANHQPAGGDEPPAIRNRAGARPGAPREAEGGEGEDHDGEASDRGGAPARRGGITIAQIRELCSRTDDLSRSFERGLIEDHSDSPLTRREVLARINDELVAARQLPSIDVRAPRDAERGSPGQLHQRLSDALYARMSGAAPTEQAREFMGASMIDMARGIMEARGERVRWSSPTQVVERMSRSGAHTTSDFPQILGSATERYLADLITAAPSPLRAITRQRLANDFRRMTILKMGANPALLVVGENGEFKHGSAMEESEGYKLSTYGRIFSITRQAIINDDLGAFVRIFEGWARKANDLEADLLAAQIAGNGLALADGKTLFHADHGNLAASGAAISVASLSAARQAMRTQKDVDGVTPINIVPKYLVVGAAKETEAEQVLAALQAATPAGVNPFSGKLELVVDGRLTGNSWRLFADPAQWPVIEEARLAGQEDVFVDTKVGFEVDGIQVKARMDIAAAATDWRGAYLNPGA
jgi:HK97 family phage prohead protease